jgi:hypothetical protein
MKKWIISAAFVAGWVITSFAQLTPQASPASKLEQRVGLTDISIRYSRPSKKGREIFGNLLPFGQVWRTGANENTTFTNSDALIFGKDTLKPGTYALYTRPGKDTWDVIFYSDATNWGTPDEWNDNKVALSISTKVTSLKEVVETFTITIDALETSGAKLTFVWDKTSVSVPFQVPTDAKVMSNIQRTMAGPSATDLNGAALYYLNTKKDLKQALEWSKKACEMKPDAYWMFRTLSLIQAETGDKKAGIETAKKGLALAEAGKNQDYVKMFTDSIKEWSK